MNLEVGELCIEAKLLNDARIFATRLTMVSTSHLWHQAFGMTYKLAIIFALRTRHHHLATGEDQSGCLGLANAHDDGSETLGVVLRIAGMECDGLP